MSERKERESQLKESIRKIEERQEYLDNLKKKIEKEASEEADTLWRMERSVEQMKENCVGTDVSILDLLEEKSSLIKTMRRNRENLNEECKLEFSKERRRLETDREDIFYELNRLNESEEDF